MLANSVNPDQTPHHVASDLGLHCFPVTIFMGFQVRSVLLIWIRVGQGPTALAVGAGGGCLEIFSLVYHFYFLSPSLWERARYRLIYCLKGPLSPKQPTNQHPGKNGLIHI